MNPTEIFCPNMKCVARGEVGKGNIKIHSQKEHRYKCKVCQKTFAESKGTVYYRIHKIKQEIDLVEVVVTLLGNGCPIQAIVKALEMDERTVSNWQIKAGQHCEQVHKSLVEKPKDLGQVQCDEIRVKQQGLIVWMAMAIMVKSRLWLGGVINISRNMGLISQLMQKVRDCARIGELLICVDGLVSYIKASSRAFSDKEEKTGLGRKKLKVWPGLLIAQVVKQYSGRIVTGVKHKIVRGTIDKVEKLITHSQGSGWINTSYIERLNATFRQRLCCLVRKGRALSKQSRTLHSGMYLVGTLYNFCIYHKSLRIRINGKYYYRTPAMASSITDHCWSVRSLLTFRVPPPAFPLPSLPKPLGRPRFLVEFFSYSPRHD